MQASYRRGDEGPVASFYEIRGSYYPEPPAPVRKLVDAIEAATDLPRRGVSTFPTDAESTAETAAAFVRAAGNIFFAEIDLDSDDASAFDSFVIENLVDPKVRLLLDKPEQYEALRDAGEIRIPDEPLLFYALGCFVGEWLTRHADARWFLYPDLDPRQSFPALVRTGPLSTIAPFSVGCRLLSNPRDGRLADLAKTLPDAVLFRPIALCASVSDSEQVLRELTGKDVERAAALLRKGKSDQAFNRLETLMEANAQNGHLLARIAALGWEHKEYAIVHSASELQLALAPDAPETRHGFAAIESMREGGLERSIEMLEQLIETAPTYGHARLTLASCYREVGRLDEATELASWLVENDPALAQSAQTLLSELG